MVLVDVEVLDKEGRRCPTATHMIDFRWDGPMDWRGGIAQGPNNYILSESLPVEAGVNRVMLRTRFGEAGGVKIHAQRSEERRVGEESRAGERVVAATRE